MPLEDLHTPRFRQLIGVPLYYDMGTDQLMVECNRAVNAQLGAAAGGHSGGTLIGRRMTRSKSVYSQRNLGTIRQRRREKQQAPADAGMAELMMRILRMRPGTRDFLAQQVLTLGAIAQQAASPPARPLNRRGQSSRTVRPTSLVVPPVPALGGPRSANAALEHRGVSLVDRPLPPVQRPP